MTFGERLVYARKKKGLNQKQFAELIGVSSNTLRPWENGNRSPHVSMVRKIVKALEVSEDWLMGNDDNFSMNNITENQQNIKLTKEQQKLVADNEWLIGYVYHKVFSVFQSIEEYEYFYGRAAIGLCNAAIAYNEDRKRSFSSFAFTRIEWEMLMDYKKRKERKKRQSQEISLDQEISDTNDTELGSLIPDSEDEWEALEYKILVESVYQKVEPVLSDGQKKVFRPWLHGKEYNEIAKAAGISINAVKCRLRKTKVQCKALINPEELFT